MIMKVELLEDYEKSKFEEIIQKLLRYNHLDKYLLSKKAKRELNQDYQFVKTNYDAFNEYLKYAGFHLQMIDDQYERSLIYIESSLEFSKYKLNKLESACLFVFRYIYEEEKMNLSSDIGIFVSLKDLYTNLVGVFGVYNTDPSSNDIREALKTLEKMGVIKVNKTEDEEFSIEIFPYICYVLTNEKVKRIAEELRAEEANNEIK